MFCATKYCIFEKITITEEVVKANISERLLNINADKVDLLQLHWQSVSFDFTPFDYSSNRLKYDDPQYIRMAQLVEQDPRVLNVGLCNFDTQRMEEIIQSGVAVVSNQVQASSLILHSLEGM